MRRTTLAILLLAPTVAWGGPGQEAFDRGDYVAAVELWRSEAAEGSAEAMFGLGLTFDLGLGVRRSPATALQWYLEAADDGLASAQFNVAVMLDAGVGVPHDPVAAASWYARAAANGNARAQYDLALLYEDGIGVPRDPEMARIWFEAASPTLPAAAERLGQLSPVGALRSGGASPQPVTGVVVGSPQAPRAELVWTGEARRGGFRIEVAQWPRGRTGPPGPDDVVLSRQVDRTAIALDLPAEGSPATTRLAWRVGRGDAQGGGSAWSPWRNLSRDPTAESLSRSAQASLGPALERLTIYVNAGDGPARGFAQELSDAYATGGLEVVVREARHPASATTIEYRYDDDAPLAASIAEFLPVLGMDSPVQTSTLDTPPGEVTLRLVGGPAPVVR